MRTDQMRKCLKPTRRSRKIDDVCPPHIDDSGGNDNVFGYVVIAIAVGILLARRENVCVNICDVGISSYTSFLNACESRYIR